MRVRKGDCMKLIDFYNLTEAAFKKDGCIGIDKVIETENAWIFTPKRKDNEVVYGDHAIVVFKGNENDAYLFTPELGRKAGNTIREVTVDDLLKAS